MKMLVMIQKVISFWEFSTGLKFLQFPAFSLFVSIRKKSDFQKIWRRLQPPSPRAGLLEQEVHLAYCYLDEVLRMKVFLDSRSPQEMWPAGHFNEICNWLSNVNSSKMNFLPFKKLFRIFVTRWTVSKNIYICFPCLSGCSINKEQSETKRLANELTFAEWLPSTGAHTQKSERARFSLSSAIFAENYWLVNKSSGKAWTKNENFCSSPANVNTAILHFLPHLYQHIPLLDTGWFSEGTSHRP